MSCPKCAGATVVMFGKKQGAGRLQYRKCKACGFRFKAYEEGRPSEPRSYVPVVKEEKPKKEGRKPWWK